MIKQAFLARAPDAPTARFHRLRSSIGALASHVLQFKVPTTEIAD